MRNIVKDLCLFFALNNARPFSIPLYTLFANDMRICGAAHLISFPVLSHVLLLLSMLFLIKQIIGPTKMGKRRSIVHMRVLTDLLIHQVVTPLRCNYTILASAKRSRRGLEIVGVSFKLNTASSNKS